MAPRYELAIGLNKGHKTTKIRVTKNKNEKEKTVAVRPARLKGVSTGVLEQRDRLGWFLALCSIVFDSIGFVLLESGFYWFIISHRAVC